jgi:hypothetical protein
MMLVLVIVLGLVPGLLEFLGHWLLDLLDLQNLLLLC